MTEEKQTPNNDAYKYAIVAQRYLKQKDGEGIAKSALEKMLVEKFGEEAGLAAKAINTSRESMVKAADDYSNQYLQKELGEKTIGELATRYEKTLKSYYDENDYQILKLAVDKFKDKKYGDIQLEAAQAKNTLEAFKLKNATEEEAKKAMQIQNQYSIILNAIELGKDEIIQEAGMPLERSNTQLSLKEGLQEYVQKVMASDDYYKDKLTLDKDGTIKVAA